MEFGGKGKKDRHQSGTGSAGKRNRHKTRLMNDERNTEYSHRLQFYNIPPTQNISLSEFEEMAISRLKGKMQMKLTY